MDENQTDIEKILAERAKLDELLRTQFTKKITVMFSDIKGSTAFYELHGNVHGRLLVHRHNELVLPVIEQNRGVLIKTIGDATMSVFNDPADGVRAARQIQERLLEYNAGRPESEQINVRIGLNTGLGIVDEKDVFGDVVNTASRVEEMADGGEVCVTEDLYREVKDNKEFVFRFADTAKVKGKMSAIRAFRLVWHKEDLAQGKMYKVPRSSQPKPFSRGTPTRTPRTRKNAFVRIAKLLLLLVLAMGFVMLAVSIVSKGVLSEGAAVATQVQGTAQVFSGDAPAGRLIKSNDTISKGDRVETQGNSRIELRLPDGGYLRLGENARLTLKMLQYEKATDAMYLQASLERGNAWVKTKKRAASDSRVDVITAAGRAAVKDAVCEVAEENTNMTISVYEGVVTSSAAGKKPLAQAAGQTNAPAEVLAVDVPALQQVSVSGRDGLIQTSQFDPKTAINDWTRWNLQRDAREDLLTVTVAPSPASVLMGRSLKFTAAAHYPDKSEKDVTWFATWNSSGVDIAKIDPSGTSAGVRIGAANITAAIEDMTGSTLLNVIREILSIKVTPASGSIVNGSAQQFTATGTFSDKTTGDITSAVVWKSSNHDIAVVDANGRAVAGNVSGTAMITASVGTKRGSAALKVRSELVSIKVLPESAIILAGDTQKFGAIGNYSDKTTQDVSELVNWESSDIKIAVMDQVQAGRVLGQKAGTAVITATYKNLSSSANIEVEPIKP